MSMSEAHSRTGEFRKVGENLYRYSSNGVYYARFRSKGKSIYRSLKTTDRELAKRKLNDEIAQASKIDPKLARMTLAEILRHPPGKRQFITVGIMGGRSNKFQKLAQEKWALGKTARMPFPDSYCCQSAVQLPNLVLGHVLN
jgi:hypothetical protein